MRIKYDSEVDILVMDLGDLMTSVGAEEIAPGVWLDLDANGTPLAIEVLGASKRYPMAVLEQHPPDYESPLDLGKAAVVAGVTPQALQKAIVRGRLQGQKIGKTWFTSISALTDYLNSRAHEGPGSAAAPEGDIADLDKGPIKSAVAVDAQDLLRRAVALRKRIGVDPLMRPAGGSPLQSAQDPGPDAIQGPRPSPTRKPQKA